jgi:hypothetical protein
MSAASRSFVEQFDTSAAAFAVAVADELERRGALRAGWVTAEVVATHLDVERDYVYEHAVEFGARRLGEGPRARLRFRLDLVDAALEANACPGGRASTASDPQSGAGSRRRRRRALGSGTELLPVRGRS